MISFNENEFKNIFWESVNGKEENQNNYEQQYDNKNKDGKSVNFQGNAKEPMVNKYGCYLFSLVNGAGEDPKKTDEYYKKFKDENKINSECLVQDPAGIASEVDKEHDYDFKKSNNYDPNADIAIARFNNGEHDHFVQMGGPKKDDVSFDSLGHSNTVATGEIQDWRLLYKKD